MPASKAMMRPVVLSRPENKADLLAIFCDGGPRMASEAAFGGRWAEWAAGLRGGVGGLRGAARVALAGKRMDGRGGAVGRGQRLRLHAPRRGLPRLPRVWLIRILLLLGIALVWIALVGIALILVTRIGLLRAAGLPGRPRPLQPATHLFR